MVEMMENRQNKSSVLVSLDFPEISEESRHPDVDIASQVESLNGIHRVENVNGISSGLRW